MSERNSTCSSDSCGGTFSGPTSANGTRTYLGLSAGVAAHHVRVAEQPRGRSPVELLGHPGIGVRVVAGGPQLPVAEEAATAGDCERDDPVADLQPVVVASDVDDFAHELVAEDVAAPHGRNESVEQVQIRAADRCEGDLDDGIARVEDPRLATRAMRTSSGPVPAEGIHPRVQPLVEEPLPSRGSA